VIPRLDEAAIEQKPQFMGLSASDETMNQPRQTVPFAPFEWMLSTRYLRARRREGFISVIAGFSFLGIMLGVATLIIVMAAMNGFRKELYFLSKLPADVDVVDTVAVLIMALTLSLLATLYPSWRAARLDPVEALR
jgi:ABC-type lipoprotein release transport system permease subunit